MVRSLLDVASCAILLFALVTCDASERSVAVSKEPPNVLLISLDTTRADHCSFLGYGIDTTPNLKRLALQGASFEQAFAPSPSTGPSHATMFTSMYPIAHGLVKNTLTLGEEHVTLAEVLRDRGYQTASVVSSFVLDSKFGFSQGFQHYDDEFSPSEGVVHGQEWEGIPIPSGTFDRRGDHTTERAIRLLESRDRGRPIFLFVHFFDPHAPYAPPEPFRSRFSTAAKGQDELSVQAAYDAEIAFTDHQIGKLLAALRKSGLERNTLIVIVGDHGEGLSQHGWPTHGVQLYEEAVRVPLLISWPGRVIENSVVSNPAELLQLGPTILDLLDIEGQGPLFESRTWTDALEGKGQLDPHRAVFLQTDSPISRPTMVEGEDHSAREDFAIRWNGWKFIEGPQRTDALTWSKQVSAKELFDLGMDPAEQTNVLSKFPEQARLMADKLHQWKAAHSAEQSTPASLSEEELQGLRSLGYVE